MYRTLYDTVKTMLDYMFEHGHLIRKEDGYAILGREPGPDAPGIVKRFYIRLAAEKIRHDFRIALNLNH